MTQTKIKYYLIKYRLIFLELFVNDKGEIFIMDNQNVKLGLTVRNFRKEKNITINQLAKETGFTPSFISQFERGLTTASVSTLQKITNALSINLTMLFNQDNDLEDKPFTHIVKNGEHKTLEYPDGKSTDYLLTRKNGPYEVIYSEMKPGASSGESLSHNSSEETLIIIEGHVEIKINENIYTLETGDSISFYSQYPHAWRNIGDETLKIIWVIYPPTY